MITSTGTNTVFPPSPRMTHTLGVSPTRGDGSSRTRETSPGPILFKQDQPRSIIPMNSSPNQSNQHQSRSRAFRNQNHIIILSPRALVSTVPGVVPSTTSTTTQSSNTSTVGGFTQRVRSQNAAGYNYTSKMANRPGAQTSRVNRYNFHAASMGERAAAESLSHAVESSFGLSHAALAAFGAASIPAGASSTLSHYSNHPVTFASQPGVAQPPPVIPVNMSSTSNFASAGRVGSPRNFFPHGTPIFDPTTGAQLPPLGYRPASKDAIAMLSGQVPIVKHDRASQTDVVGSTGMGNAQATPAHSPQSVHSSIPSALSLPPTAVQTPSTPNVPSSIAHPAAAQSGRRFGYDQAHTRLLELHHPAVWQSTIEEGLEEDTLDLDHASKSQEEKTNSRSHSRKHSPALQDQLAVPNEMAITMMEDSLSAFYLTLGKWDEFDIFQLYDLTNGWPLSFLFMMIDKKHHFLESNNIDPVTAFHFIQEVESNYLPNPYHTATHAADVLHAAFHLVEHTPLLKNGLSPLDCFVLYVSCAVHDFQHPGVNNSFLVNSRAPLALRYNDRSVLESFHISSAFRMMHYQPQCNILGGFTFQEYSKIRKTLVDLVLATDLAVHFELMSVFKRKLLSIDVTTSEEDKLMIMQIILKCGDLSHPARSRRLHLKWSELVTEEFFLQGDREKILSLPPSMFMDRHTTNLAQSQIGFITFLVFPMFQAYSTFSTRDYWAKKVEENLEWWHEVARVEADEKKQEAERLERGLSSAGTQGEDDPVSGLGEEDAPSDADPQGSSEPNSGSATTSAGSSHVASRRASVDSHTSLSLVSAGSVSRGNTVPSATTSPNHHDSNAASTPPVKSVTFESTSSPTNSSQQDEKVVSIDTSSIPRANDGEGDSADEQADTLTSPKSSRVVVMPVVGAVSTASFDANSAPTPHHHHHSDGRPAKRRSGGGEGSNRKKSQRRSMTSSVTENLALLSETAQLAALNAAGASATEAKEHQEEEQAASAAAAAALAAQQAANAASPANNASGGGTMQSPLSTKAASGNTLGLLLNSLPAHKRKSVMKGVAPPASPLVLHRNVSTNSSNDADAATQNGASGSPSGGAGGTTGSSRSLGVTLSERRALSLNVGPGGGTTGTNGVASPLQIPQSLGQRTASLSLASPGPLDSTKSSQGSTRSSLVSPAVLIDAIFENGITQAKDAVDSVSDTAPSHMAALEQSHGVIYLEVRELASLTAVQLEAASLTAPVPTLSPSNARPFVVPQFSKKAHQLLDIRPKKATETPTQKK